MKLIIWWLALMIILPLLYLSWWKKRWRLLLGIVVFAILAISFLLPSEYAYSIITAETEKDKPPLKKLEMALRNLASEEPNPSDPEKLKLEKEINKLGKNIRKLEEKKLRGEKLSEEEEWEKFSGPSDLWQKQAEWVRKWGKKEKSPTFLFCGEQFNEELSREGKQWGEKTYRKVKYHNIIDFGKKECGNPKLLTKRLREICEQNENDLILGHSPIIWLKNIDKITNSELKKELLKIVDPNQNSDLGEYYKEIKLVNKTERIKKTIDLSQFTLVATTSTDNPQLSPELRAKLKHIEPFFDKYFWVIFVFSLWGEIIIFFLLFRSRNKDKNKTLK